MIDVLFSSDIWFYRDTSNLTIESSGDDFTADIVTTLCSVSGDCFEQLIIGKTGNTRQIDLSSDMPATGTQTYNESVVVGGDRTVSTTNSNVIFASTVNSDGTQRALTPMVLVVTFSGR